MAQYVTDFGSDTIDSPPSNFTSEWQAPSICKVVAETTYAFYGNKGCLVDNNGSDYRMAMSYDTAGTVTDAEILTAVVPSSHSYDSIRLYLRGSGGDGTETAYYLSYSSGYFAIKMYNGGSVSTLDDDADPLDDTSNDYPLYIRFGVSGTTVRARWWLADEEEPTSWLLSATDSTLSSGWVGFGQYQDSEVLFDFFSVGTSTDSAALPTGTTPTAIVSSVTAEALVEAPASNAIISSVSVEVLTTPEAVVSGDRRVFFINT